jgi:hypothetical protein
LEAGISIFRLGGKGKGMQGKNEKKRGLNWKIDVEMLNVEC